MSVRDEQPENALHLIFVTDSGMLIFVRDEQPENANSLTSKTDGGIINSLICCLLKYNKFLGSEIILVIDTHEWKVEHPISVTDGGMLMLVRE